MENDSSPEKYNSSELSKKDSDIEDEQKESDKKVVKDKKRTKRAAFFEKQEEKDYKTDSSLEEKDEEILPDDELEKNGDSSDEQIESEGLTEPEAADAVLAFIESRNDEMSAELDAASENSSEELEILTDVAFLELLREKIEEGLDVSQQVINEAFNETIEDLDIEPNLTDENENISQDLDAAEAAVITAVDNLYTNHAQNNPPIPPNPPSVTSLNFGSPQQPNLSGYIGTTNQPNNNNTNSFNSAPQQTQANPNVVVEYIDRRRRGRDILVGGIVGYIIGRRGGRKRTEKKLTPKIKKLESEVGELHDIITEKEDKIRKLTKKLSESELKTNTLIENRQKRAEIKNTLKRREELAEKDSVKKLTKFTLPALEVFREKRHIDGNENSTKRKSFETMNDNELLEYASFIIIDGTSVAKMFKQGRLDRKSLLEIVKNYYRSGSSSFERIYWKELKNDPQELENHRDNLEKLHEKSKDIQNNVDEYSFNDDSGYQKQKKYSQSAESNKQSGSNERNFTGQKNLLPWIALAVFASILLVGYLLLSTN